MHLGKRLLAILALTFATAFAASAQSGRTFYIDEVSGNNANAGTKVSPWQSSPYMQTNSTCRSNNNVASTYTHQAGDTFIFKGGVTWVAACFPMNINQGGSSNTIRDSHTVDQTWFTGGSFTKPIFAGQNAAMDGMISITASNINLSYLNVGGWHATTVNGNTANCDQAAIIIGFLSGTGYQNITASYMWLHDWLATSAPTSLGSGDVHGIITGGMCINQFGTYESANVILDHSEVSDAANIVGGQEFAFGACGMNIGIQYTHCHDLFEGIVQHAAIHDNEFDHISYNPSGSGLAPAEAWNSSYVGGGQHTNVIESNDNEGDGPVYNNYVHSTGTFGEVIAECTQNSVYNNVVSNVSRVGIRFYQCVGDSSSSVAFAYNNTVDQSNCYSRDGCPYSTYEYTSSSPDFDTGIIKFRNNISIGSSYNVSGAAGSVTTPNYQMPASEAAAHGFVSVNKYAPSSTDSNTSGTGTNLTSSCSGILAALCQDTRGAPWFGGTYLNRSTSWDMGAFLGTGGGGSNPPPTSAVTAPTQNQSISGSSFTITSTCTPGGSATVSNIQFYIDTVAFGAAGTSSPYSLTLDSTKMGNAAHSIYAVCTQSDSQNAPAATINFTVSNSTPGCQTSNTLPANVLSQGVTSQTGTFTATWTETPNSSANDTVFGLSTSSASGYSAMSALLRANTSGAWDAFNGTTGTYTAVNSAPYTAGTAYSFTITVNFGASTYSLSETSPSSIVIATNYAFRAAATSLAFWNLISDQGVYDTAKVCNFQITGSSTLSFSQPSINFGNVSSGSNATQTESVTVTGSNVTFTGATVTPSPFTLDSDTCNGNTVSGCLSHIKFAPVSVASFMGTLCYTNNATGSPQCINLTGTGVAATPATVTLSTNASNPVTSINFNSWLIFNPSGPTATITGTVVNGPATISVSITGGDAADFKITSDGCTASVSSQCQETFQFTPHRFGIETTTAAFAVSGQATQNVTLVATSVVSTQIIAVPF